MKKIIVFVILMMVLTACSNTTSLPYEIDFEKISEIRVDTSNKSGHFEKDEEWSKLIDVMTSFKYESISEEKIEKFDEEAKEFNSVTLTLDDGEYGFYMFGNKILAYYQEDYDNMDFDVFIATHDDIIEVQEELSELGFPDGSLRVKKPVIYIYPEEEMKVTVSVFPRDVITTSYPEHNDGWQITASPDGVITSDNGKHYSYLYWEGDLDLSTEFHEGFIVHKDDVVKFLEGKLDILGLNYAEKNDFITYWIPELEQYEYSKIRFCTTEIDEHVQLKINPQPDTLIRFYMLFAEANKEETIKEQHLKQVVRKGYTVVEWGGAEVE